MKKIIVKKSIKNITRNQPFNPLVSTRKNTLEILNIQKNEDKEKRIKQPSFHLE